MNIALFIPDFNGGGAERAAISIVESWSADSAHRPFLIARANSGAYSEKALALGARVLGVPRSGLIATARTPGKLARVLSELRVSVVVAFLSGPSIILAKRWSSDLRVVWSVQNPLGSGSTSTGVVAAAHSLLIKRQMRWFLRQLDGIIAPSAGLVPSLRRAGWSGPVGIVVNPLSICPPNGGGPRTPEDGRKVRIVAAGRLVRQKRFDVLLRAVGRLSERVDS
ncbi:MAG: glycosyltransferase, partial [Actinomycetota bacterium]|nr:glycosyltransferase [Actinomycetota bacterium]